MRLSHLRRPLFLALLAYAGALCILRSRGLLGRPGADDASRTAPRSHTRISGVVASLPEERRGRQEFFFDARSVDGRTASGRVWVRLDSATPVDWGEGLTLDGRLIRPPENRLPGVGGWKDYLELRGARAIVFAKGLAPERQPGPRLLSLVGAFRRRALRVFHSDLGPENAELLGAVILGEKAGLDASTKRLFRDAGAVHLLVTAGLHVGFVLLFAMLPLRRLGLGRGASLGIALAAAGFYVLAAGAAPPLIRAYLMAAAAALGGALDRDSGPFQGLVLAAWILLIAHPLSLFEGGFQLSFAAVFGILAMLSRERHGRLAGLALVSLAAQLAVSPILASIFHRVSLAAVLSNLALVPAAEGLMAAGFALLGASLLPWRLPEAALAALTGRALSIFSAAVRFFARLPGAAVWVPSPSPLFLAGYAFLALAFFFRREGRRVLAPAAVGGLLLAAALLRASAASALYVGLPARESGALIRTPEGRTVLINAPASGEDLAQMVLASGGRRVDAVYLTDLRRKNWRGLAGLAAALGVGRVVAPPGPGEGRAYAAMRSELERRGVAWTQPWPGFERLGGLVVWREWRGYSGRPKKDGLEVLYRWQGLRGSVSRRGEGFDWRFDIIGPSKRLLRRAEVLRFDGAEARLEP